MMRRWVGTLLVGGMLTAGLAVADTRYKVVGGDNIRAIATKMSVPIDEVLRANPQVTDPNKIWPGMTLNIPASSPLAGGAGISDDGSADPVTDAPGPKIEAQSRSDADTVREGVPEGLLRIKGLTWRGEMDAWEVVVPDCGQETCSTTVTVQNIGGVPVEGLKVTHSAWYYMLKVEHDCGALLPGEQCDILVTHPKGFKAKSPGFLVIQASDAFIRPPDEETIWFWDTVFWICPAADDPRCGDGPRTITASRPAAVAAPAVEAAEVGKAPAEAAAEKAPAEPAAEEAE